jgi:hypothetical protein
MQGTKDELTKKTEKWRRRRIWLLGTERQWRIGNHLKENQKTLTKKGD